MGSAKLFSISKPMNLQSGYYIKFAHLVIPVLLLIFFSGCDKDNDIGLQRKFLNDGYIHYSLKYTDDSTNIDLSGTFRLYSKYELSSITNYGHYNYALITRYSADLINFIQLDLLVDSTNSNAAPGLYGVTYSISSTDKEKNIMAFDNTVHVIGVFTPPPRKLVEISSFSNVKLDTLTKQISGDFDYKKYWEPSDGSNLEIKGDFSAQLYEFLN